MRQLTPVSVSRLKSYRLTELRLTLSAVLDCRNPDAIGLSLSDLTDDANWDTPHALAEATIGRGAEGILVPSATRMEDNLIVFPPNRLSGSTFEIIGFVEPRLYRDST